MRSWGKEAPFVKLLRRVPVTDPWITVEEQKRFFFEVKNRGFSDMTFWLDKIKKSLAPKIYREKDNNRASEGKELSPDPAIDGLNLIHFFSPVTDIFDSQTFRIYASTWNVGGRSPHVGMNLNDFIPEDDESDIYVLGFQEIVPLNAGNVLVIEDNEPAAKWIALVDQALNRPVEITVASCPSTPSFCAKSTSPQLYGTRDFKAISSTSSLFQKPSLDSTMKAFRRDQAKRLRGCNCPSEVKRKNYKTCFRCPRPYDSESENDSSEEEEEEEVSFNVADDPVPATAALSSNHRYRCIVSKQMVGIFVTVWAKKEIVQHISHLQISCVGRGIMGRLGNKGCISVSMSLHQSTFCFICSHLASGQKEGDELRRNSDVTQILKNTRFRRICQNHHQRNPKRILDHDRVIWLGDLNYRIALSYSEAKALLEQNNWDALLEKDQLRIEREAGRVFKGWKEGKIYFPPTYKYSDNSDSYMGENTKSKSKRRTPAWCDRILWHGDGITVLFYIRGESRLSDHRPVFAVFAVDVEVLDGRFRKELSTSNMKVGVEELLPSS